MSKDIKTSGKDGIQKLKDRWSKKDEKKDKMKIQDVTLSTEKPVSQITTTIESQLPTIDKIESPTILKPM